MAQQQKTTGIKPNSIPVKLAKGGKEYVRDTSKKRMYKVKGE